MNIYVCLFIEREDSVWHHQFTRTLRKIGHNVFIPPEIGLQKSWYISGQGLWTSRHQRELTDRILSDVRLKNEKYGVDLFFCLLFPFQITPGLFKELKALNIPSAYFFCDNISNKKVAEEYAPHVTLNWVTEPQAMELFKRSKSRAIYLPMAANPEVNYPIAVSETVGASFVGLKNPHRRDMLGRAAKSGLDLRIYGLGWFPAAKTAKNHTEKEDAENTDRRPGLKDRLSSYFTMKKNGFLDLLKYGFLLKKRSREYLKLGEEYEEVLKDFVEKGHCLETARYPIDMKHLLEINKIYGTSSVSIGFNDQFTPHTGVFFHTNHRNFEATMAGACYLGQATPDLGQLFRDGKEIMIFHDAEELIDKANFLLKNDTFRKHLRAAGRERTLAEHTWENRFERLFDALGMRKR